MQFSKKNRDGGEEKGKGRRLFGELEFLGAFSSFGHGLFDKVCGACSG